MGLRLSSIVNRLTRVCSRSWEPGRTIIQSIWITGTTHNKFKFLFQKIILCQDKTECLLDDTPKQWKLLIAGLSEGEPISVPRKYFNCPETNSPCDFCDASLWAYVTVNYLRVRASASVTVRFVVPLPCYSCRRYPIESPCSVPPQSRLSLCLTVSDPRCLRDVHCYTDSQVTLSRIRGIIKCRSPLWRIE